MGDARFRCCLCGAFEEKVNETKRQYQTVFRNDIAFCFLPRLVEHIFDEDAVALCGIIYQNVCDCSDELAVLNDGAARQE